MASPTLFSYEFEERGPTNNRRSHAFVPVLIASRFRPPRVIVNRLAHIYEKKQQFRSTKNQNMRRNRPFMNRSS